MLTFWEPFREFDILRREIDRAFDTARGRSRRNAFLPGSNPRSYPLINVAEDGDAVYVEALAPGIDPEKLEINVLRNQLTISGEKVVANGSVGKENYHRSERAGGRFTRGMTLPAQVDADRVSADYEAGILRLTLPKAEEAKPRKIAVSVA